MRLESGVRVKMNPEHQDYNGYMYQHKGDEGVVTTAGNSSVRVRWANGHENTYENDSLIILDEAYLKKIEEENKMYELPFLTGTRVCLNPESSNFGALTNASKGTAGNVLYIDMDDSRLPQWSKVDRKAEIYLTVMFDNGWEGMCKHKDLLQVDTKPQTITKVRFRNGMVLWVRDDDPEMLKEIDKYVITNGETIYLQKVYDNEWRAEMVQKIMSAPTDATVAPPKPKSPFSSVAHVGDYVQAVMGTAPTPFATLADEDWDATTTANTRN